MKGRERVWQAKSVLVVDDQPGIRMMLHEVLVYYGYQVALAQSGAEALAASEQQPSDLVLLDVNMPGLSGVETLAGLRRKSPNLPVIMVTGEEDSANWERIEKLSVQGQITKPFDLDELVRIINDVFDQDVH